MVRTTFFIFCFLLIIVLIIRCINIPVAAMPMDKSLYRDLSAMETCGTFIMPRLGLSIDECTETYMIERDLPFVITDGEGNITTLPGPLVIARD